MRTLKVDAKKYKSAEPIGRVTFTYPWQNRIHPVLLGRIAYVTMLKDGRTVACNSGFRSAEEQISAQKNALATHPDYYQGADGRVYNKKGQSMAAPVGLSNHNWGLAADSSGTWLEKMSNAELQQYGLRKPMSYEPWHVEPVETAGMTLADRQAEFYDYMGGGYYPMDIKSFQMITGLKPDGVAGPATRAKAAEINAVAKSILAASTPVKTGAEAVKWLVDNKVINSQDYWIEQMAKVKNLDTLLVKMVNEMNG